MRVYDILGKKISSGEEARDLYSANVRTKSISLFRGYRGLVKAVTVLTERVILPYSITENINTKSSCIA
jgi:hypothetical protein